MADTTEARQILDSAEHAAASGDFTSAERLLREAAAVQERTLGGDHPDLANTLNNLGVVCERAGRPDEAEQFYRHAHAIATSALPADHPFVATSRKNLEDLCASMGKLFDAAGAASEQEPTTTGASAGSAEQDAGNNDAASSKRDRAYTADAAPLRLALDTSSAPATRAAASVPVPRREEPAPSSALSLGAVTVAGIAIAIIVIGWIAWPSRSATEHPPTETADTTPRTTAPTPPSKPARASPAPTPRPAPVPGRTASRAASSAPAASPAAGALAILDARLCKTLTTSGEWKCDSITSPASPGTIAFYTRIASPRATTVQHRWYYGDRLRQSVMLEIQPNGAGYRTYSRNTISADRTGEWRVELRSEDGRVLREERFTVR